MPNNDPSGPESHPAKPTAINAANSPARISRNNPDKAGLFVVFTIFITWQFSAQHYSSGRHSYRHRLSFAPAPRLTSIAISFATPVLTSWHPRSTSALEHFLEGRLMAGSVRSATAALEHSTSRHLGLADRRFCGKLTGRNGSKTLGNDWQLPGVGILLAAFRR